ncbi:MAG: TolC family protein [Planctomycetaceae bacterium]
MNRSLIRSAAYLQIVLAIISATGCSTTQPFFANESPELQHYLSAATQVEYPDVETESLAETVNSHPPLTLGNHEYGEYWDLELEEAVSIALQNAKFFVTTSGTSELRQNVGSQFTSGTADQFGSIYDIAIQQTRTQSIPLTVDGAGNRTLPRGVLRANQIGGVEDALAEFDAQVSGFLNFTNTDRARNTGPNNPFNPQLFQAVDNTQQAAISKRLATGGVATLRQQVIYGSNNVALGNVARAVTSDWTALVEAQVQHPLMRNRGTLVNRIPVVLASLNEDIAISEFEIQVRNLVRDVEVAYWDLYVSYRNVATAMVGRNSAQATQQFARLSLEGGAGTKQDLAQATVQYYQFKGLLESALAGSNLPGADRLGVYGAERQLREKMGLAPTDGRLIRPVTEPNIARVEFDWDESVAQMLYLAPELRRSKIRIQQNEQELILAKNQILPEVNLSLLYRWVGVGDTLGPPQRRDVNFPAAGSSALGELTEGDFQEGAVRLDFQPTAIGSRRELTRIRGAQLEIARSRAFLQEQERLQVSQLSDAVAKMGTHYQLVQTNAQRWQAAEQEVQARLAEYKGGRMPVNVVLQSQQRRAEAQIDYYRSLAEYSKSINYVHYTKGTLLHHNNIELAEGCWNKKAYWDALERARERSAGRHWEYGVSRPAVVRQGEIQSPEAAAQMRSGLNSLGTTTPPDLQTIQDGEMLMDGPLQLDEAMGSGVDRQPIDMQDMPLEQLAPPREMMRDVSPADSGESVLVPPAVNQQMSYEIDSATQSVGDGYAPQPVRKKPVWKSPN